MQTLEAKHSRAIRWMHWINVPLLGVMLWSGLLIYWADDIYRAGIGDFTLFRFFPDWFYKLLNVPFRLAEGMAWHFLFAWLFTLNGALYVLYTAISGEWRYLVPTRRSFREAVQVMLHDLGIRKEPLPRRKFNGAQQIAYTGIVLAGAGSVVTGLAVYKPVQFGWLATLLGGYQPARLEHFALAIGYVLFFGIHITQVIRAGWNNLRAMVTGYEVVSTTGDAPNA